MTLEKRLHLFQSYNQVTQSSSGDERILLNVIAMFCHLYSQPQGMLQMILLKLVSSIYSSNLFCCRKSCWFRWSKIFHHLLISYFRFHYIYTWGCLPGAWSFKSMRSRFASSCLTKGNCWIYMCTAFKVVQSIYAYRLFTLWLDHCQHSASF